MKQPPVKGNEICTEKWIHKHWLQEGYHPLIFRYYWPKTTYSDIPAWKVAARTNAFLNSLASRPSTFCPEYWTWRCSAPLGAERKPNSFHFCPDSDISLTLAWRWTVMAHQGCLSCTCWIYVCYAFIIAYWGFAGWRFVFCSFLQTSSLRDNIISLE